MGIVETLKLWIDSITPGKFDKVWEEEGNKRKKLYWDAVKVVAISLIFVLIIFSIVSIIRLFINSLGTAALGSPGLAVTSSIGGIFGIIMSTGIIFIIGIILFIINQYIFSFLAGLFSKNKEPNALDKQSYLMALVFGGASVIDILVLPLTIIPCVGGLLALLIELVLGLLVIYATYNIIKAVYKLNSTNAAIVVILNILFWSILAAIIIGALFFLFMGSIMMISNGLTHSGISSGMGYMY